MSNNFEKFFTLFNDLDIEQKIEIENSENSIESKNLDDSIINKEFLEPLKLKNENDTQDNNEVDKKKPALYPKKAHKTKTISKKKKKCWQLRSINY